MEENHLSCLEIQRQQPLFVLILCNTKNWFTVTRDNKTYY